MCLAHRRFGSSACALVWRLSEQRMRMRSSEFELSIILSAAGPEKVSSWIIFSKHFINTVSTSQQMPYALRLHQSPLFAYGNVFVQLKLKN